MNTGKKSLAGNENQLLYPEAYENYSLKEQSDKLLVTPLKVIALLVTLSGVFALIFEVRYYSDFAWNIYASRLTATLVSFTILVILYVKKDLQKPILLVHTLLLSIILSSSYMIYLIPDTLVLNAQIMGLMIFTSALFLSWEVKNQIIVAIYYNVVFAAAILLNESSIYFLPNMYESLLFVMFLSFVSVFGSAVNYKLRIRLAENSFRTSLSEKKYRQIFQNAFDGIFQTTAEGQFITANDALVKMLGYSSFEEMETLRTGKDIFALPEQRAELVSVLKKKGSVKDFRVDLKRKDGSVIHCILNDRIVFYGKDNQHYYFEGTLKDITAQVKAESEELRSKLALKDEKARADRLAEDAIRNSRSKSEFLANMSHEIRTPLNGIIGYLSLLDMEAFENKDEMKQYIFNARQSSESLLEIINEILDLSKIESGKFDLESVSFNLTEVIEKSVAAVSSKAAEKELFVTSDVQAGTPLKLKGDPLRIRQILVNLIGNGIKFTSTGGVTVKAECTEISGSRCTLKIVVSDTGIGIPADKINNLFKPFSQIKDFTTKQFGGTGLGLAICKKLVNAMGGEIGVNSTRGNGSDFHFTMNLLIDGDPDSSKTSSRLKKAFINSFTANQTKHEKMEKTNSSPAKTNSIKILVAEDNPVNQKVLLKFLKEGGYDADVVVNGKQAVDALTRSYYDLILMDIQMPEMDGITATKKIRAMGPDKSAIPIIAITANALHGDKEKYLDAGMNDFLPKPIQINDLFSTIGKWLNKEVSLESQPDLTEQEQNPLFDFNHLDKISMGSEDFKKELLATYISDLQMRVSKLEHAISSSDFVAIVKEAHTIKGSSKSIGATLVGDEALALELSGKHNDTESIKSRLPAFSAAVEDTIKLLQDFISK